MLGGLVTGATGAPASMISWLALGQWPIATSDFQLVRTKRALL